MNTNTQDDTLTVVCEMHVFTADSPDRHTSKKGLMIIIFIIVIIFIIITANMADKQTSKKGIGLEKKREMYITVYPPKRHKGKKGKEQRMKTLFVTLTDAQKSHRLQHPTHDHKYQHHMKLYFHTFPSSSMVFLLIFI